ncbi:hypothetical protein ABK046_49975, partial [Streptomyces caeruleatus]
EYIYFFRENVLRPIKSDDYFLLKTSGDGPVDARSSETGRSVLGEAFSVNEIRNYKFREVKVTEWIDSADYS